MNAPFPAFDPLSVDATPGARAPTPFLFPLGAGKPVQYPIKSLPNSDLTLLLGGRHGDRANDEVQATTLNRGAILGLVGEWLDSDDVADREYALTFTIALLDYSRQVPFLGMDAWNVLIQKVLAYLGSTLNQDDETAEMLNRAGQILSKTPHWLVNDHDWEEAGLILKSMMRRRDLEKIQRSHMMETGSVEHRL